MAEYSAGSVFVQVVPSFQGVVGTIEEEAAKWGDAAGAAFSKTYKARIKEDTQDTPLGPSDEDSSQKGSKSAGAFADGFKARIEAALRDLPDAKIDGDSTDADRKIAEVRAELLDLSSKRIGIDISDAEALAKVAELKAILTEIGSSSESIRLQVDTAAAVAKLTAFEASASLEGSKSGGSFSDAFTKRVDAALRALPEVRVDADTSPSEAKLASLRADLEELSGKTIGVDLRDDEVIAKIAEIKAALEVVAANSPSVRVRVDAGEAIGELTAFEAAAAGAGGGAGSVGNEAAAADSGFQQFATGAAEASSGAGLLIPALAALAAALVPIGALAAGALAGLPALFAGAAGGIGALKLGLGGISGALSDYSTQQSKAGKSAASAASAGASQANQATSNAASIRNAANAVQSAQEALDNAQANGARSVAQAQQQLATAQVEAANAVHQANEQLVTSEQSLTNAQYAEQQAQQAVIDARKAAQDQLASYTTQLADAGLAQRQAALDVQTAHGALTTATQPGSSATSEQQAQAQLTYDQAVQHQKELGQSTQVLQDQAAAAAKAGVEGNLQVVSSEHQLLIAKQATATAQQALTDAQAADGQAQVNAIQKVTNAQSAFALAQTQSAQQVGDAQRALSQALAAQADASAKVATATGGASAATDKFAQDMANMSPAGRSFVNFLIGLKSQLHDFSGAVQGVLLPQLQSGIQSALPALGSFEYFILLAANSIGDLAEKFGAFIGSAKGQREINTILASSAGLMEHLGDAALTLFEAFTSAGSQAGPIVAAIGGGVTHLVDAFAKWVENGGFQKFLTWLRTNGPSIISDISSFAKGVGSFIVSIAPVGLVLLKIVGDFGKFLGFLAKSPALLGGLSVAVGVLGIALAIAMDSNPIGLIITAIALLVLGIIELVTHWRQIWGEIKRIIEPVWKFIENDVIHPLVDFFSAVIPPVLHAFSAVWDAVWKVVHAAITVAWSIMKVIFEAIVVIALVPLGIAIIVLRDIWSAVWPVIHGALTIAWSIMSPVFGFVKTLGLDILSVGIGALQSVWNAVWPTIHGAITAAWSIMSPVFGFIKTLGLDILEIGIGVLSTAWSAFWSTLHVVVQTAWDLIKPMINFFIDGINALITAADVVPGVNINHVPHIGEPAPPPTGAQIDHSGRPAMAAGGIVNPRPGGVDVTVAEAGQREVIAPLDDLKHIIETSISYVVPKPPRGVDTQALQLVGAQSNRRGLTIEHADFHDEADFETIQRKATWDFLQGTP